MEGHELLAKMNKVQAPPDFEAGVLARLPAARAERSRARRAHLRYAFAGSAALVIVGFLIFSPATAPEKGDAVLTQAEQRALSAGPGMGGAIPASDRNRALPVYERMNYASELRDAQSQPRTVYILEQVSEVPSSEIIY
jgi:hypothetical protein